MTKLTLIALFVILALSACRRDREAALFGGIARSGVITREAPHVQVPPRP